MYLLKYILKRVLLMLFVFIVISTMCFVLIKMLPNRPAKEFGADQAIIEAKREMMGYDRTYMEQYFFYIFGRVGYTYDVLDEHGNKIQETDTSGNLKWLQQDKLDENGDVMYWQNEKGEYLDASGNVTTRPGHYVALQEDVLDENGNKIPVYKQKTVYNKADLPESIAANSKLYTRKSYGGIIRGSFGPSEKFQVGVDVGKIFADRLPYTMAVNLYSILLSIPLGLGLGIIAALKKNKWQDHVISIGVMIFVSVPSFIYGFIVKYLFYYKLGWTTSIMDTTQGPWSWTALKTMYAAVLCLSFGSIAGFARYTRAELTEVLTSEFMLLARTKGLTRGQATLRHALRNAMVPIFPMILGEFVSILSGSLIIEDMYSIPGVGALYVTAVQSNPPDTNLFMLIGMFYTLIGLVANIVVDISYGIIDPRIRMGAR